MNQEKAIKHLTALSGKDVFKGSLLKAALAQKSKKIRLLGKTIGLAYLLLNLVGVGKITS